jgi:hypothetical protein
VDDVGLIFFKYKIAANRAPSGLANFYIVPFTQGVAHGLFY